MSARLLSHEGQDYKMVRIKEPNAEKKKKVNSKKCPTDSKLPIALGLGAG